jgi:tetratricopeptide (TPR) repeat protein
MQLLDLLLSSAHAARATPERADELAAQAIALARASGAGELRLGRACLMQATARYRLFDYPRSFQLALEAAELLGRAEDAKGRARAMNLCLAVSIETGELIRALDTVRRALTDARARGDRLEQARLLVNQAVVFDLTEESDAAVRCLAEAIELFEAVGTAPGELFVARVNLDEVLMGQAERAGALGRTEDAMQLRRRVAATLPAFDAGAQPAAVNTWISVKARLGDIEQARTAAVHFLRRIRAAGHVERFRAYALLAVGELHVQAGRPGKGAHRLRRAAEILRAAENWSHLGQVEVRLARLYAESGDFVQALRWQRQAENDGHRLHGAQQELRWRLAALEREAEARRARRREEAMHAQRLAVVGRLISEVYHALAEPIAATHAILTDCVNQLDAGEAERDLVPKLTELLERVDAAAALVRQLKMFSYRAAPQSMDVTLGQAVEDAWKGLSVRRGAEPVSMAIVGDQGVVVEVDAQRLAVLLRILLIEVEPREPGDVVRVEIERSAGGATLRLSCRGARALRSSGGTVGVTLCAEIAQEMGGQLMRAAAPADVLCFELRLPVARTDS